MREETTRCHQTSSSSEARRLTTLHSSDSLNNENMIKYVILISTLACLAYSERPSYAGSASRYPLVLPQYTTTTTSRPPSTPDLVNRIDSINDTITTRLIRPASSSVATTAIPQDLPIEVNGDRDYLNMIMSWPRDKQPFWFINQQQINAHRGVGNVAGTATQSPQTQSRSFFAG